MSEVEAAPFADVTEEAISMLVDRFYARVMKDSVLGPVFDTAISSEKWPVHLVTMKKFWSSVMLASGRYSGNPVAAHRALATLERPMFARWLAIFEDTAHEMFSPDVASQFTTKAHRIAGSLEVAVFHRLGAAPDGLQAPGAPATVDSGGRAQCE